MKNERIPLTPTRQPCTAPARIMPGLGAFFFAALIAFGQEPAHPLKPPDRSSPRAAIKTFLDSGDALATFLARDYLPSPSRAEFHRLAALGDAVVQSLDLSEVAPATRVKTGRGAALALYDTLNRIQLPPSDEIPTADQLNPLAGTNAARWVIPNTEIVLVRTPSGPRSGEFLFSAETVARADEFYERVRGLAYSSLSPLGEGRGEGARLTRPVPLENMREIVIRGGGWLVPYAWVKAMPAWLRSPLTGQAAWKWLALTLILGFFALLLRLAYRLSRRGSNEHPFRRALAQMALPAFFIIATPAVAYLALVQINLRGSAANALELVATAVIYLAGAWISWRLAPVVAEAAIASPHIPTDSVDAHLIRICTRLLGMVAGAVLLAMGADRLGIPVYGIVAGLGVGGLAIALAAQTTVENLIGGLSLFADKSIRVGDFCRCGTDAGTVETIGIRSTWIRGADRTLTTIPNAALSKMSVVNFGRRDKMLIQSTIGVRYETSPEQLRYLLAKIREMLLGHPRIHPDAVRARFIGFGASSLDIEVFAYVTTTVRAEFLAIQEDVLLRVMDLVEQCGTGFAFPSQTLYFGRDDGVDARRTEAAEAQVRQWRDEGRLPFPDFSPEQVRQMRGAVAYPPPGSSEASTAKSSPSAPSAEESNSAETMRDELKT
ncbi:MAG: mechanosensitive ion channel family protein [Verrucomicrobia bacterium]|nr:mechanosensitive ion channel family protein [Verrucomicrobiota bacterium]